MLKKLNANITILNQTAMAEAAATIEISKAMGEKIKTNAIGSGFNHLIELMNIDKNDTQIIKTLFNSLMILDSQYNPKVIVGDINTIIQI